MACEDIQTVMRRDMHLYNVLIVDADAKWGHSLREEIMRYPFFSVIGPLSNGRDALAYITAHRPQIIVLDLVLTGCDGLYLINYIREELPDYQPYLYAVSGLGTEKTNNVLRGQDVNYYSVKPIDAQVIAYNLHKLIVDDETTNYLFTSQPPLLGIEAQIEDFMYELGAPLYLVSTKCTCHALQLCLEDESKLVGITALYSLVAEQWSEQATSASVERNVRSAIKHIQRAATAYFLRCFPHGQERLTNADFLNRSVYLLKRRIEEYFGSTVFVHKHVSRNR